MRVVFTGLWMTLMPFAALAQEQTMKTVVDFAEPHGASWTIVNDGVMGGLSSSDLELTESGTAIFSGFVSLKNNGGFASVRATFSSMDLAQFEGVTLKVRGDGRRYQLRFRGDEFFDGIAHTAEFETVPGEWMEVDLPFQDFRATFRGRSPRGTGPLDAGRIRQMGILIGDKKEGPFSLEMAWVKATSAQ